MSKSKFKLIDGDWETATEFIGGDGIHYVAKDGAALLDAENNCDKCAFRDDAKGCVKAPLCSTTGRTDGKEIFWIKKEGN